MLWLSPDWKRGAYFRVICGLAGQIRTSSARTVFGVAMLAAALDVLAAGLLVRNRCPLRVAQVGEGVWSVGRDGCFVYLPDLSRRAVAPIHRLVRPYHLTWVVGPAGTEAALSAIGESRLPTGVRIESLDSYIDFRVVLSAGDLNETTDVVFARLLRIYHSYLPKSPVGRSLAISAWTDGCK